MKVSIITVVYNNPLVERALESILAQKTEAEVELIVIDGASTDCTQDVLHRFRDRIAVLKSEPDHGIYDAMNKGLALATGDIIGTLNSDDLYWDDHSLAKIISAFQKDATLDAVYGDLVYVAKTDTNKTIRFWKSRPFTKGLFSKGWMPPHPTFFIKREIYQRLGLFDLEFKLAADFELMLRFLEIGEIRSIYIPHILVRMRMGGATNKSIRNIYRANRECVRAAQKNGIRTPTWFIPRKLTSKVFQFFLKLT